VALFENCIRPIPAQVSNSRRRGLRPRRRHRVTFTTESIPMAEKSFGEEVAGELVGKASCGARPLGAVFLGPLGFFWLAASVAVRVKLPVAAALARTGLRKSSN